VKHVRIISILFLTWAGVSSAGPNRAAVASAHYLASEVGIEILDAGGNAFDAAVAMSATLAVVEPSSSGLGGGGLWMLHFAEENRQVMVDGREKAPAAVTRDMYLNDDGSVNRQLAINGPLAAGIPGEAAALEWITVHYGKLSLAENLAPAIRLAKEGFPVDEKYHSLMRYRLEVLRRYPASAAVLLDNNEIPRTGFIVKQADLARTLETIARDGAAGFYTGPLAAQLVEGVQAAGGIWTLQDLADYKAIEREPLVGDYRGHRIVTATLPSSGGIALLTALNILAGYDLAAMDPVIRKHVIVEAMRRAYRDRAIYPGDMDFVTVPIERLIHPFYASGLRASIRLDVATPSASLPGADVEPEGTQTTHFSVIDHDGNMVAATLTVNIPYGSGFMVPGTGVLLNDEMDDFSAKAGVPNYYGLLGDEANAIEPGKRPLSSMTPTFVFSDQVQAALGTPGGGRITTMVLLGILDLVDGNPPRSWVSLPRYHHQFMPDEIVFEPGALSQAEQIKLMEMGHALKERKSTYGNMHAVMWHRPSNGVQSASDARWPSGRALVQ